MESIPEVGLTMREACDRFHVADSTLRGIIAREALPMVTERRESANHTWRDMTVLPAPTVGRLAQLLTPTAEAPTVRREDREEAREVVGTVGDVAQHRRRGIEISLVLFWPNVSAWLVGAARSRFAVRLVWVLRLLVACIVWCFWPDGVAAAVRPGSITVGSQTAKAYRLRRRA